MLQPPLELLPFLPSLPAWLCSPCCSIKCKEKWGGQQRFVQDCADVVVGVQGCQFEEGEIW